MPEPSSAHRRVPHSRLAALRAREDPDLVPDPRFWGDDRASRSRSSGRGRDDGSSPARGGHRVALGDSFLDAARDRWLTWRGDARLGVVGLLVVAGIAGVVWYRIGTAGGAAAPPATAAAPRSVPAADAVTSTTKAGERVAVHVAGAVTHPGVVELAAGSRVIDAVEAAGGGLPEADLDRLNLAARLVDGQQVLVARVGDPPTPGVAVTGTPSTPGAGTTPTPVNVNTATQAELETLPGIGPALATAILDERDRRGGFGSVNELREVRGIGEKRYADLRDKVTV